MMNIVDFLSARLDEDERMAREAHSILLLIGSDTRVLVEGSDERNTYLHIERHSPARTLNEVAAKRSLIAAFPGTCRSVAPPGPCGECEGEECVTIWTLAAVWSDHPDYDPEWAA
jgi:hypothetical protein